MFILGHLGIGRALVRRWVAPGLGRWLALGTLLPDLLDKPLYYALAAATGRHGAALGLISGTRTVGHTLLLLAALRLLLGRGRGSALAAGMATHLFLDELGEVVGLVAAAAGIGERGGVPGGPPTLAAVLFPLLGPRFPVYPFKDVAAHLFAQGRLWTLCGELAGALLLWRELRARPTSPAGRPA